MSQQPPPFPQPDDSSFEKIFEQLLDMMQFAVDNADQPVKNVLPQDLEARLSQLEKEVEVFCNLNQALLEETNKAGLASDDVSNLPRQDQRNIERAQKLIQEAQEKLKQAERRDALDKARGKTSEKLPRKPKDEARERKKKFKKFGQDKNWKPL